MPPNLERVISQKAIPSTYFIQTYKNNPDTTSPRKIIPWSTGTGVSIDTNLIATACHVVTEITLDSETETFNYEYLIVKKYNCLYKIKINIQAFKCQ